MDWIVGFCNAYTSDTQVRSASIRKQYEAISNLTLIWQSWGVMETSQREVARETSNGTLGELLQVTAHAEVDFAGQENAGNLHLGVGNVRLKIR